MLITAWILFIFFGLFSLRTMLGYMIGDSLSWFHALFWLVSIIITAISAGIIWGGLFSNVG